VWATGQGVSRAEKQQIEKGDSWRKGAVLKGGKLTKRHKRSSVHPEPPQQEVGVSDSFAPPELVLDEKPTVARKPRPSPQKSEAFGSRLPDSIQ